MSRQRYAVDMSAWRTTPIVRSTNPLTGLIEGDDLGYRRMTTLRHNRSPLVVPNVLVRAYYDGDDEWGKYDSATVLPGGLMDRKLVLRETAARGIELLDQLVWEASDGEFIIAALDGFRSEKRQVAGFNRLLRAQMNLIGLTDSDIPHRIADFMVCGGVADGTFSYVKVAENSLLDRAIDAIKLDADVMKQITDFLVRKLDGGGDIRDLRQGDFEYGVLEYLTISANYGLGHGVGLRLNSECNAHAGAGACDVFVIEAATGRPINPVYFDYPGPEAGMDFMEGEGAYERYLAAVQEKPLLRLHLEKLGETPEAFTFTQWQYFQGAIRILYHAAKGAGFTYYSSEHGGENWHLEPGNIIYEPSTGGVVASEILTAELHPDSGNPGHTLQTLGKSALAVWGGATAHQLARDKFGLA